MLVLSLHIPQTCGARSCLQLPTKHSAVTAPSHLEATVSIKREDDEACVCLRSEE